MRKESLRDLGWIKGKVKKFDLDLNLDLPHMGWNTITLKSLKDQFSKNLNHREFYFCILFTVYLMMKN